MARGGARPNPGPKKGQKFKKTLEQEAKIRTLEEMLRPHQAKVATALVKKAKTGDVGAIKEYHERLIGKVREKIDLHADIELDASIETIVSKIYGKL